MPGEVLIRPAEPRDVEALTTLAGQLGYPSSVEAMASRLRALLALTTQAVLVAERGSRVIGWIHVSLVETLESDFFAEIRGLVVDESVRGGGIGSRLVAAAEAWAAPHVTRIRVRSNVVRTDTHRFYEQRGYTVTKSQKTFDKQLS